MEQLLLSETDYCRAVGARLRQLIDVMGVPYAEVAAKMGASRSQLGNWMRGDHGFPRHYCLYRLCRIYGVTTDWILLGDPSGLPLRYRDPLLEQALAQMEHPAAAENQAV